MTRSACAQRPVRCVIVTRDRQVYEGEEDSVRQIHAETVALRAALGARANLYRARAYVYGVHHLCWVCGEALRDAGIESVEITLR